MLKNIINVSSGYFFRYAFQLAAFFYLAKALGAEKFGEFSTVYAISICLASVSAWGGYPLIARNIAKNIPAVETYSTSLCITAIITLPLLIIAILINQFFYSVISYKIFIFLVLSESFFMNAMQLSSSVFISFSFFKYGTFLQIFSGISRLFFSLIIYLISENSNKDNLLDTWAFLYFINSIIIWLISYCIVSKKFGKIYFKKDTFYSHWKSGYVFTISGFSEALYTNIDKVILSFFLSYTSVGIYSTAYRFVFVAYMPLNAILTVSYKKFFELGRESFDSVHKFALKTLKITFLYSLFAFVSLISFSFLIERFLGQSFAGTKTVLMIMSFSLIIQGIYSPFIDSMVAAGKEKVLTIVKIFSLFLNIMLNIFFLKKFGLLGAVFIYLISHLTICIIIFYKPNLIKLLKEKYL